MALLYNKWSPIKRTLKTTEKYLIKLFSKKLKNFKKVLDFCKNLWYYIQAVRK